MSFGKDMVSLHRRRAGRPSAGPVRLPQGKYFGASTTFVRAAGFVGQSVAPEKVAGMAYFTQGEVTVDWQFLFVVGVLFGALASAWLSKEKRAVAVPQMWEGRFGPSVSGVGQRPFWEGWSDVRGASRRWVTERSWPEAVLLR